MPYYRAPRTDVERQDFGRAALIAGNDDRDSGNNYVTQESLDRLTDRLPPFQTAMSKIATSLGTRHREIEERNLAYEELGLYVRHAWDEVVNRAQRLKLSAQILEFYGLPLDGTRPRPNNPVDWVNLSRIVLQGDLAAMEAGYPRLTSPSYDEIQAVLDAVLNQEADVPMADRVYDKAQAELAELRPGMDEAIEEIMADLRYTLRKLDQPSQRRIMRTYGARFEYAPGEPPDEDDPEQQ